MGINWKQLHCPVCEHELDNVELKDQVEKPVCKINPYDCPNCGRRWNIQIMRDVE